MNLTAIDLFAGLGGNTEGAKRAGLNVLWAANHDRTAVDTFRKNHKGVDVALQDLSVAKFSKVVDHDVLLASCCCQGHADCRGTNKFHHEESRSTAWCVFTAASKKRPKAIIVENVPEFTRWTESDDPGRRGNVYRHWLALITTIGPGYHFSSVELNCADLGVPQDRNRLFLTFVRRDVASSPVEVPLPRIPHRAVGPLLEQGSHLTWSKVADKAATTRGFVERSRPRFPGEAFLVTYNGATLARGVGRSLDRPIGTVTTRARFGLVDETHRWMRMLTVGEYRTCMDFPEHYVLPGTQKEAIQLLGNAVPPASMAYVLTHVKAAIAAGRSR